MSPNRVAALYIPLLFAPLAGAVAAWIAAYFPGLQIPSSKIGDIFIAGSLIALAAGVQWVHGWQKHEARQAESEMLAAQLTLAEAPAPGLVPLPADELLDDELFDDELDELDDLDDLALELEPGETDVVDRPYE